MKSRLVQYPGELKVTLVVYCDYTDTGMVVPENVQGYLLYY